MAEADRSATAVWDGTVHVYELLKANGNLGMSLVPLALAISFCITQLADLRRHQPIGTPAGNWYYSTKLIATILVLVAHATDCGAGIFLFFSSPPQPCYIFLAPAICLFSTIIALISLVISHKQHQLHYHPLSLYWLLAAIFYLPMTLDGIKLIGKAQDMYDIIHISSVLVMYTFTCIVCLFSLVAEPRPVYKQLGQEEDEHESPENEAGFLSTTTFDWMGSLIYQGWQAPIKQNDLWTLNKDLRTSDVTDKFNVYWDEQRKLAKPSLIMAMTKAFGKPYFTAGLFKAAQDILTFLSPILLKLLIAYSRDTSGPAWHGFLIATALFVVAFLRTILLHQYFHRCFQTGLRLRSALMAAIYQKSLVLSNSARKESTQGEITNLMSVDAQRIMDLTTYLHIMWSGPFQMVLALYLLYDCMGPSIFAGVGVMVVLMPLNSVVTKILSKKQHVIMRLKDQRMVIVNECLSGIRVIKMYAWEDSFLQRLMEARARELKSLAFIQYAWAAMQITWGSAPFLVSLATFATYVLTGHVLVAEKAFVALALFNLLQFPISMLPFLVVSVSESAVAVQRISKFLLSSEIDQTAIAHAQDHANLYQGKWGEVSLANGTFAWDVDETPVLNNICLNLPPGSLTALVGRVGSGKSSLVQAILGNLAKLSGDVFVNGKTAYVAQEAWIQNATIRENILFGRVYDEREYHRALEACAMLPDLDMLPAGDMTEIGEKGINLSGGQKQRISLARAIYQDCDVYLLDDPLSAVDSHVAQHIFSHTMGPSGLLRQKTVLLVTHRIDILSRCDYIAVLENGAISAQGTYDNLSSSGGQLSAFLEEHAPKDNAEQREVHEAAAQLANSHAGNPESKLLMRKKLKTEDEAKLTDQEAVETGGITWSVLSYYLSSLGWIVTFGLVFFCVIGQVCQIMTNVWLSVWASDSSVDPKDVQRRIFYYLGIYCGLGMSYAVAALVSNLTLTYGGVRASKLLHDNMLANLIRAPMMFFDVTPLGRIINRFSKDLYTVDQAIPSSLQSWLNTLVPCIGTVIVISYSTPAFLVVVVPLVIAYILMQRYYVATSRQLKRLESVSRSPIFSHFGETLNGIATIRAYGLQNEFVVQNQEKVDTNGMAYYGSVSSNRWLAVRLEIMGNLLVFFAALFAVLARGKIDPAFVGLSIGYAMGITQKLNWLVRMTSELESNIVAVERVQEYTNVPQEAPAIVDSNRPRADWPSNGEVVFTNYSLRYRPTLDLVLKGIDLTTKPMEKIGIVGRTGAGKSSLSLALFRMVEGASGSIEIDGVDIAKLGLYDLRSRLTIIPQDPLLFVGTVRSNLDPFGQFDDAALWRALQLCHLEDFVRQSGTGLETVVTENGSNLSVGQRQLMCLGRALLRKSKVLVLDEATAAVDVETDQWLQRTIRLEFSDCTVLVIAHRLNTIMDSDRVLVLSDGKVAEFDSPAKLLSNPNGILYSMARESGLVASHSRQRLLDLDDETRQAD